ncbi:MAG: heavy metal translocating P-type ATPase [Acholeplasmataceae bacterium]|nr:heavy metal translocating P-type ATPase [Acholeplasmataceae bacterium]
MKHIIKQITFLATAIILFIVGMILQNTEVENIYYLIVFGLSFIIGSYQILLEGVSATIKNKALNVELLMILASIGAFFIGEYQEGAMLILIFSLAHILEEYATLKSEKSFKSLLKIAPDEATLAEENDRVVPVGELLIGQIIKVKVGEKVPVDGIIIEGSTAIDEQMITGEFVPANKSVSDHVYAGTINMSSTILVKVEKDPQETIAQKIIDFVKTAQEEKTERQTIVEKIEKWYVYGVILLALLVLIIPPQFKIWSSSTALNKAIIVLVVASPCALVASITPAVLASLSSSAKQGILIKGGRPLERARTIDTVVFDKTGTITKGVAQVVGYKTYNIAEDSFLKAVVSIEKQSAHPLAKAIVSHFSNVETVTVQTIEKAGIGIEGVIGGEHYLVGRFDAEMCDLCALELKVAQQSGLTVVNVARNNKIVGFIELKDTIREDAPAAIEKLNKMNITTHMLTGDNYQIAENVKKELKISSFKSEYFPEEKVAEIKRLKDKGKQVAMIGDGINDAPALTASDLGIAMGSATDVSLEVADIVFINNKISSISKVINLSKRMHRIVIENIVFSIAIVAFLLFYNLLGNMKITLGVIFHEGSTILVILNSLRLLIRRKE